MIQMIKIKYVGKNDAVVTEYNGVKYTFSRSKPVQTIPWEVFQHWNAEQNPFRNDIVPFQDDAPAEKEERKQTIAEETDQMEKEIKELDVKEKHKEDKRGRGRPRKE